jgi:hypothetical protein
MDNRHWRDKWSAADLAILVCKRETEKKRFVQIAIEMERPEGSCWRRYTQIVAAREPAPSIAPEQKPRRIPFHRQMVIETYTHMQAILCDPNGIRGNKQVSNNAHWYRMPITLAKVLA